LHSGVPPNKAIELTAQRAAAHNQRSAAAGGDKMIDDRPSRTAERAAMQRAAHQLLDDPRVHDDPLALTILDPARTAEILADPRQIADGPVAPLSSVHTSPYGADRRKTRWRGPSLVGSGNT
jgi:hypothetical protein